MNGIDFTTGLGGAIAWPWPIAVYLFFAGISGGALTVAMLMRIYKQQTVDTPLLKAAGVVSVVTILLGMLCLVLDLTNPLFFWKILVFYNFNSVMSLGVVVLCLYIPLTMVIAAFALRDELAKIPQTAFLVPLLDRFVALRRPCEWVGLLSAVAVCAYTGFLISALVRFPIINSSILPALFVVSGLSAGTAVAKAVAVKFFGEKLHSKEMHLLHGAEWPIMAVEAMFIFMLFSGLIFGDAVSNAAMAAFSEGVWGALFWFGVVGLGFVLPLAFNFAFGQKFAHSGRAFYATCFSVVSAMMCLRLFLLMGGQIYGM
ncbi:NrfD/PsrC family molybdoenzyme membrane anchor subunit [Ferrimonas balearica]|uniref:NrfD/PsrC family molybdoenzyme membrane anchor subunit n=1 Tax=Ferrimonas balearica TaxID=44012 RepID=UPI001C9934D7|nr:NrfD/PsrC family molybdoenzyme membrane anchor subunit [Ferrimonas balearica]MBY5920641.1 polysulfide reductase NrfD [Ferrimonas balearica]MBY5996674.1 polysulfide reductase NrfD [Ferrimonas balearica]